MRSRPAIGIASLVLAFVLSVATSSAQAPPSAAEAQTAIDRSPRHGEWVSIASPRAPVKSWVMYPERGDKAPVVMVIHPGAALDDWTRAIADHLAADGYIAIAPDLEPQLRVAALDAVRDYALKIPAANGKVAALGFEHGGGKTFEYALAQPALDAAIAISSETGPQIDSAREGRVPMLGLYGAEDKHAKDAIARASAALQRRGMPFEHEVYENASADFLSKPDASAANEAAARMAWARVLAFLRQHLQ
jgi:carboxymethylenebutenolidase